MKSHHAICVGALFGAVLWLTGCATSRHRAAAPVSGHAAAAVARTGAQPSDGAPATAVAEEKQIEAQAHYGAAVVYELQEQRDLSLNHYQQAALADPANENLVLEVVQRLLANRLPEKAVEVLNRAVSLPSATAQMYASLGSAYGALGKTELAINANRAALKKRPLLLQAYQNLVQLRLKNRQPKEALGVFEEALSQSARNVGYTIDLAEMFARFRGLLGSEADKLRPRILAGLDQAAQQKPEGWYLLRKLAEAYSNLGEPAKGAAIYQLLITKYPGVPGVREQLAAMYLRAGDNKRAAEQLEAVIRENPANAEAYYLLGTLAAEANDLKKAAEYYEKALLFNARQEVYFDLVRAQIGLHQPEKALQTLGKVQEGMTANFLVEYFTALAYGELKEYPEAIKHLTAAEVIAAVKDTNRLTHELYFELGAAYERNKDYEQAERNFLKCLSMEPKDAEALNYLGYMWAERGIKLEQAKDLIEKAVKISPNTAAYIDSLGWVLFKLNQPQQALVHIQKAVALSAKPDPTLLDHLGDIQAALRQPDKAREAWRKSLELEPNETIKRKLESAAPPPK